MGGQGDEGAEGEEREEGEEGERGGFDDVKERMQGVRRGRGAKESFCNIFFIMGWVQEK